MYFKSLELFGFKSFADKTRLDFEPGITAIVGPNGCGKSNIADGIKWVLGEQSARMLRGGKMEDVIFNGSDGKEPVNYAEVSLTLSNQDRLLMIEYDEVTVTRRLYRSGESEYLLNKTPVRLKDINELFMGTGIGTTAYSLIEQGRIDQILSSKPEDRREVFEEASGITKYKSKKREALRRLEDTEQNLVRINDIIQEVKRQINSIERQARKAERYKEGYEELKELELRLSRIELEMLRQKLSDSNKDIDKHRLRESELNNELLRLSSELSELNLRRSQVESERIDFKSSIIETDSDISKSRDRVSLNKERIEELKKKRTALEAEIQKNQENIKSQHKEVANLKEKAATLETEGERLSSYFSEKEKRLQEISRSITEDETIISTSKANVIDLASRGSKLRNNLAKISASIGTHEVRLKRLEAELQTISEEKNSLNAKLNDCIHEADSIEREALSLKSKMDEISQDISRLSTRIEDLAEESKNIHKAQAMNKSRLEVLEEAKAKYEGFSSGVRSILGKTRDAQRAIEGARDVLANILSVKKGYERAIEACLGENLQSIVVDDMGSAVRAINFLKENSCGKASFIHPASFGGSVKAVDGQDLKDHRVMGKAIDFVDIDEFFKSTLSHLLKNIFIVKDLEDAAAILQEHSNSGPYVFVTILGEIVRPGFISGGDIAKEGITLLNRDLQMKELSQAIIELERRAEEIGKDKSSMDQERIELEKNLSDAGRQLNEKEILSANAANRRGNIEENIKGVDDEISLVNLELYEVKSETENFRQEEETTKEALIQIENETRLNEEKIKKSEDLMDGYAREKEQLLIETTEQRTELGSLKSKKEGLLNTLNILEASLKDTEDSLKARKIELEDSIKKAEELDSETLNLEKNIETLSETRIKGDRELEAVERIYSEIMGETRQSEVVFKQSEKEVNEIRSLLHEVDLKKAETNYGLDNLRQRIRDVYKVDLDEVQVVEDWQNIEREQLKKDVEDKRAKLDAMGPVNLVAIEEHTGLQDRHAFLTNQCDDLLKAKESLLKAIAKINKTTKELFIETFKNIQVEFRNFFKMLFGGGDGELILLDEGDVLESGIEIVARPPGKRLQNVSLLSGGERALTAIALIFAIFKVKPSPFCVLDEIDAPLDESNIGRFSKSLEIFTKASQFIVITHNKKTIDMADVMYGITMQESGISKVVSVKFSDGKKQEDNTRQEVEPAV